MWVRDGREHGTRLGGRQMEAHLSFKLLKNKLSFLLLFPAVNILIQGRTMSMQGHAR